MTATKFAVLLAALGALAADAAVAQTSSCQAIQNSADRLACYDRATPPSAAKKSPEAATKSATGNKKSAAKEQPNQSQVVDMLAAENAKLDAKLKTICRGC